MQNIYSKTSFIRPSN